MDAVGRSVILVRLLMTLVITAAVLVPAVPGVAQPRVTTPWPAVDVAAGDQVDIELHVAVPEVERVGLAVTEAPEGWATVLRAGGFTVSEVTATPEEPTTVTLQVTVPADADEGNHPVVVTATGEDGTTQELAMDLRVAETATQAVTLDTDFATLQGGADDTFDFSVTLDNDVAEETTFQLAAQGPEGWDVSANPSSQSQANTVTVEPGGSTTLSVTATPPPQVQAGTYPLLLEVAGGGQQASLELAAEVVGSFELAFTTANERLNGSGVAGAGSRIDLVITNNGSAPLAGVELGAGPPSDWDVTFEPVMIDVVPPGESVPVQAVITPAGEAVAGDYVVSLTATSEQQEQQVDIRFTVQTSRGWGIAAVAVIVLVVLALLAVFRRYGRR